LLLYLGAHFHALPLPLVMLVRAEMLGGAHRRRRRAVPVGPGTPGAFIGGSYIGKTYIGQQYIG
ncbi:MAG: hypothetical protein ACRDMZ_17735, partial [Solirubrobacteraceae bacterium]